MRDNMDEIPSGGIGIKIIGKIADELSYTRSSDRRNCLLIVKYYQHFSGLVPPSDSIQAGYVKRASDVFNSFNWLKKQQTRQSERSSNQQLQKFSLQLNTDIKAVAQVLWWVEQFRSFTHSRSSFASV